jgi:hypothetical protein
MGKGTIKRGVDPKPDGKSWSEGRKAAESARGYAPAPRGGSKPINLSNIRSASAYSNVWRPGYGWKPAFTRAGNSITGALRQAESASLSLTNALRATAGLGPIGRGGGGDPKGPKTK